MAPTFGDRGGDRGERVASALRAAMVQRVREHDGIVDERVLRALGTLPRHRFVPAVDLGPAYADRASV